MNLELESILESAFFHFSEIDHSDSYSTKAAPPTTSTIGVSRVHGVCDEKSSMS